MSMVLADPSLSPAAKRVAWWLLDHYNVESKLCFPSEKRLADEAGLHIRTVKRSIARLSDRGWFRITAKGGGRGRANEYEPQLERVADMPKFSGDEGT